MKNLLKHAIACAIVFTSCFNCSVESLQDEPTDVNNAIESSTVTQAFDPVCDAQDPQARITNNGTIAVTLEIATSEGIVLHTVSNLSPGNASSYLAFAADDIIFNVIKNTTGVTDEKVVYTMDQCMSFDIEVGSDNYLIETVPVNL
ncbi:MAG: hypothetical protein GYB32_07275 [Algicola sp.]|nr:hypothetical protein [Algicola sp.]